MHETADLVLVNGKITTLDRANPQARAVAIRNGRFQAVGEEREIIALAGPETRRIDLNGRRVIPGLIDSHMHVIRGGLNYNMELRWDGVASLADAMAMLKAQVDRTPAPQWVRVIGGFTAHQFAEKRLPTLDEINAIAPDTPVFILHLYDRALLNRAALRAVGYTKSTPEFPGAEIARDGSGEPTGLLLAKPNATILYATLAKGPKLPAEYQKNSTRHFMREVNHLGVTSVIDAGGGFQNYPEDYKIIEELHRDGELTTRTLNVFEKVSRDIPFDGLRWFIDHAETIDDRNIERIAKLGGGIAVQHRMAHQGEYFVERYGHRAAERTPPIRRMLDMGVPVGAGTDATRVASYNPWVCLSWLVTGKTVGGLALYSAANRLDRETALRLWTEANTWFSSETGKKGQITAGQLADLAVLSDDYFSVPEDDIADITSVLTILGGKPVHAGDEFKDLGPPLPPAMPDWAPVRHYG